MSGCWCAGLKQISMYPDVVAAADVVVVVISEVTGISTAVDVPAQRNASTMPAEKKCFISLSSVLGITYRMSGFFPR